MKKHSPLILLLFVSLFYAGHSIAQNPVIDSLSLLLKTDKEDTNKTNHLIEMAKALSQKMPDSSLVYLNTAIEISKRIGWKKGEADAEMSIGQILFIKGNYALSLSHTHLALAGYERLTSSSDKALAYAAKLGKSKAIGAMGAVYYSKADYLKAIEYYVSALKISDELGDKTGIATRLGNIGSVYGQQGDYEKSLEYMQKAMMMNEEIGNKKGVATAMGNIGIIYTKWSDYTKALDYLFKSQKLREEVGDKRLIANNLNSIGNVFQRQGDSAIQKGNASFARANKYPKASFYFYKALNVAQEMGDKFVISNVYNMLGGLYVSTGEYKKADEFLHKSLTLAEEMDALDRIKDVHLSLSQFYDTTGKADLSLFHYEKYMTAADSLNNTGNQKKQADMEITYQLEKKEADEVARKEKEADDILLGKRIQYMGIFILITIVFAFIFVLVRMKLSLKAVDFVGFVGVLLLFHFLELLLHPYIHEYTHGSASIYMFVNVLIASGLKPLHRIVEVRLTEFSHHLTEKAMLRELKKQKPKA